MMGMSKRDEREKRAGGLEADIWTQTDIFERLILRLNLPLRE